MSNDHNNMTNFNICGPTKLSKSDMDFKNPAIANDQPKAFIKASKSDGLDTRLGSSVCELCLCT